MVAGLKNIKFNNADKWGDLRRLYKSKMSLREIAQQLHVSQTSLCTKIKELGLKRKPRYKKKSINIKLFKELLALGAPNANIAKKLGVCPDTVIKLKRKYGFATDDQQKIAIGKKAAECRTYYKKTGTKPICQITKSHLENYADDIIRLLKEGVAKTEIAKRYGVCPSTVYNFIHLYAIDAPVKKICDGKEQQIKEAFDAGMSIESISQTMGCFTSTVYLKVKDMQISRNVKDIKRKSLLNNQKERIKKLYYQGVSGPDMARRLGVSVHSIYECIHRMGLDQTQRKVRNNTFFCKQDKKILKLRQEGKTLKQISALFGMAENTVLYRLRKLESRNGEYQIV